MESNMTLPSPCIGSQLFVNRTHQPHELKLEVDRMAEAGLKLIRLFLVWDHLETEAGHWNFSAYDAVFDRAAERGLLVIPTLMSVSPPGWMQCSGGLQDVANLEDPSIIEAGERYIREVVSHWASHPALHSWILWNEASRPLPRNEITLEAYRSWLSTRFEQDISKLNAVSFQRWKRFADIGRAQSSEGTSLEFRGYAESVLWLEFSVVELMRHLRRIAAEIRKIDREHPLHVNPHNLCRCVQIAGQSIWEEAELVDFLGCSSHPVWHANRFPRDRWTRAVGIFADLMRSVTPHPQGEFWVSELQGGPARLSAETPDCPSPAELKRWIWEGVGAGARGTLFWCFNSRDEGFEAGEWSLRYLDGSPSPRLQAASEVSKELEERADWFAASRPMNPGCKILRSEAAERLAFVDTRDGEDEQNPRNNNRVADAAAGAALLCADLGIDAGYLEETRLSTEEAPELLIVPGLECVSDHCLEQLLDWVKQGCTLLADAWPGLKDEYGRMRLDRSPVWQELFGLQLQELEPFAGCAALPETTSHAAAWWYRVRAQAVEAEQLNDTDAPLWKHSCGQGQVYLVGSWYFHRFLLADRAEERAQISELLRDHTPKPALELSEPGPQKRLRCLNHPQGFSGVLIDEAERDHILIKSHCAGTLQLASGEHMELQEGQQLQVPMRSCGTQPFHVARHP